MENVYRVDGIIVPAPSRIGPGDNIISRSYEDANAIFRDLLVREKRTAKWIYSNITRDEMTTLKNIIWGKIRTQGTRMFNVTTDSALDGWFTSIMWPGTPVDWESLFSTKVRGVERWSFDITWIEKEGIQLLSPNSLPE